MTKPSTALVVDQGDELSAPADARASAGCRNADDWSGDPTLSTVKASETVEGRQARLLALLDEIVNAVMTASGDEGARGTGTGTGGGPASQAERAR